MDKILAKGLVFFGCHGVLPVEKKCPQKFIVDLVLSLNLSPAGISDDLQKTVNYDEVYHLVKKIVETESYNLIEALAENIAAALLLRFPVKRAEVTIYKPEAPVDGEFEYFAVNIVRGQI
ncbi:MAG: dihydroneopterin aldolase [Syntrophomonadaceae bacterium]|jgi:dihydroneopterin aldolase